MRWGEAVSANFSAISETLSRTWNEPSWYAIWTMLVFGQKWHQLSIVLLAQAPGYLLAAVFWGVLNPALLVAGKQRQVLLWLIGFTLLYSILTRLLSPMWGAMGAAIGFSISEVILMPLLFWMYCSDHRKLAYGEIFPEIILGGGSLVLLALCAQHSQWVAVVVAGVYLIFWYGRNHTVFSPPR
jgi:O-antigen/teichoic acid export membrane protein